MWTACQTGNLEYLQQAISKLWVWEITKKVNRVNDDGFTLLHLAVISQRLEFVQFLLKNKAKADAKDKDGNEPLHYAAKFGNIPIAAELLNRQASVYARGKYGLTPLHMAAYNGQNEMFVFLLSKGDSAQAQIDKDAPFLPREFLIDFLKSNNPYVLTEAINRVRQAADQGDAEAQYHLGECY